MPTTRVPGPARLDCQDEIARQRRLLVHSYQWYICTSLLVDEVMAWLLLFVAGLLEIGFALSLKASDGFSRLLPSVLFVAFAIASLVLLNLALKSLPIGTAYAVWTGIGAAGTAALGMLVLGEPVVASRIGFIGLIVAGVIGLQLTGGH